MKASAVQIQAALAASGGNVAQAARDLGMARNNLYKRLADLALRPADYRATASHAPNGRTPAKRAAATPRISRSLYLRPDQIRALDDACLDLPAVLRERLSPSKVLERFMDGAFAEWLAGLLERKD